MKLGGGISFPLLLINKGKNPGKQGPWGLNGPFASSASQSTSVLDNPLFPRGKEGSLAAGLDGRTPPPPPVFSHRRKEICGELCRPLSRFLQATCCQMSHAHHLIRPFTVISHLTKRETESFCRSIISSRSRDGRTGWKGRLSKLLFFKHQRDRHTLREQQGGADWTFKFYISSTSPN